MTTHRFKVTSVKELNRDKLASPPSELLPLIKVPNDILTTPSLTSVNETTRPPIKLFNSVIEKLKSSSSTLDFMRRADSSSLPVRNANSVTNLATGAESEGGDSCYSTVHSNTLDTNSLRLPNKFLQELRSKRREIREKSKNMSIDERIALNRCQNDQEILRAQDIFDIHFELNENENLPANVFNEDSQEEIRNKIFHELDRQRRRQFHKQRRQQVLGRALLMLITSILLFMGVTLVYVVVNLYDHIGDVEKTFLNIEFVSIINDKTTDA
ncbi:unnamed protein product [Adineta ricciae]|uniref:Uncharacterized protein n=1 Tax=Adineta ricciae TaxID=249248 RepID=A0A815D5D9_ADIRI|nr:unnamed protein product [Adineta ricciae]